MSESKSHITLEDLLFFTQKDLLVAEEEVEGNIYETYRYVTTVRRARARMDGRGLDLAICRRLFEDFRSDELYEVRFREKDGQTLVEDRYLPNPVDFDRTSRWPAVPPEQLNTATGHPDKWTLVFDPLMTSVVGFALPERSPCH